MTKPIESAEEFAGLLSEEHEAGFSDYYISLAAGLIEARDNAVRLALLDELIALDDGMALTLTVYQAVREMRAKYGAKP